MLNRLNGKFKILKNVLYIQTVKKQQQQLYIQNTFIHVKWFNTMCKALTRAAEDLVVSA